MTIENKTKNKFLHSTGYKSNHELGSKFSLYGNKFDGDNNGIDDYEQLTKGKEAKKLGDGEAKKAEGKKDPRINYTDNNPTSLKKPSTLTTSPTTAAVSGDIPSAPEIKAPVSILSNGKSSGFTPGGGYGWFLEAKDWFKGQLQVTDNQLMTQWNTALVNAEVGLDQNEKSFISSVFSAESQAKAGIYGHQLTLEGALAQASASRYGSELSSRAQEYSARVQAEAQIAAENIRLEGTKLTVGADIYKTASANVQANPIFKIYDNLSQKMADSQANDKLVPHITLQVIGETLKDAYNKQMDATNVFVQTLIQADYYEGLSKYVTKDYEKNKKKLPLKEIVNPDGSKENVIDFDKIDKNLTNSYKHESKRDYSQFYKEIDRIFPHLKISGKDLTNANVADQIIPDFNHLQIYESGFARQNPDKTSFSEFQLYYLEDAQNTKEILNKDEFDSKAKKVFTEVVKNGKNVVGKKYYFQNSDGSKGEEITDKNKIAKLFAVPAYRVTPQNFYVMVQKDEAEEIYYNKSLSQDATLFSGLLKTKDPHKKRELSIVLDDIVKKMGFLGELIKVALMFFGGKKKDHEATASNLNNTSPSGNIIQQPQTQQQPTVQLSAEATQLRNSLHNDLIIDTTEKTKLSAIFKSEQEVLKALENLQAVAEQNGQPLDKNKVAALATTISSSLGLGVSGGATVPSGTTVAPTDLNSDPNKDLITTLVRH